MFHLSDGGTGEYPVQPFEGHLIVHDGMHEAVSVDHEYARALDTPEEIRQQSERLGEVLMSQPHVKEIIT